MKYGMTIDDYSQEPLVASLLLVAMPGAPSSFLLLVVWPGAPSNSDYLDQQFTETLGVKFWYVPKVTVMANPGGPASWHRSKRDPSSEPMPHPSTPMTDEDLDVASCRSVSGQNLLFPK